MRKHFWKYLTNQVGEPISNARIHLFKSDEVTSTEILNSSISSENIFEDISDDAYVYITNDSNESIQNFKYSSLIEITSNDDGYFEFWIADKEETSPSYGYDYTQEFTLAWSKSNITPNIIENIQLFGIHLEVDESDNSSIHKDRKNKLISNEQAYTWDEHIENSSLDEHTQYVHNSINRTISAVHTFNPSTITAPFILGINAKNQKVVGLNADKLDGNDSSYFATTDVATTSIDGLMSSTDKTKLDSINLSELAGNDLASLTFDGLMSSENYGKLLNIEVNADVTNSTNVANAGALMSVNNLSDLTDVNTARVNIGAQESSNILTSLSSLTAISNSFIIGNGSGYEEKTLSETKNILSLGTASTKDINEILLNGDGITLDNILGTLELSGGIGLFGTIAPSAISNIDELNLSDISTGSDQITLTELNTSIHTLENKINEIINILTNYGFIE